MVAWRGGAVLSDHPLVDDDRLSRSAEARKAAVCDRHRGFARGSVRGQLSQPRLPVLPHAVSGMGAHARRAAVDPVLSGAAMGIRQECMRRDRHAVAARRDIFWIVVDAAAVDDLARRHRRCAAYRRQRARDFDNRKMAVVPADRFHRPDILLALFMALAADCFSAYGWTACSGLLRRRRETGAGRDLDRRRLPVVEIHLTALPIEEIG